MESEIKDKIIRKSKNGTKYIKCGCSENLMAIYLKDIREEECFELYKMSECQSVMAKIYDDNEENKDKEDKYSRILIYNYEDNMETRIIESENIRFITDGKIGVEGYKFIIDYPIIYIDIPLTNNKYLEKIQSIKIGNPILISKISSNILEHINDKKMELIEESLIKMKNIITNTKLKEETFDINEEHMIEIINNLKDKVENKDELFYAILITSSIMGFAFEEFNDYLEFSDIYNKLGKTTEILYDKIEHIFSIEYSTDNQSVMIKRSNKMSKYYDKIKSYILVRLYKKYDKMNYKEFIKNKYNIDDGINMNDKEINNDILDDNKLIEETEIIENFSDTRLFKYISRFIININNKYYEIKYDDYNRKTIEIIEDINNKLSILDNKIIKKITKHIPINKNIDFKEDDTNKNYNIYNINMSNDTNKKIYDNFKDKLSQYTKNDDGVDIIKWIANIVQYPYEKQSQKIILQIKNQDNIKEITNILELIFGCYMFYSDDFNEITDNSVKIGKNLMIINNFKQNQKINKKIHKIINQTEIFKLKDFINYIFIINHNNKNFIDINDIDINTNDYVILKCNDNININILNNDNNKDIISYIYNGLMNENLEAYRC
jgi:hypothetical protein